MDKADQGKLSIDDLLEMSARELLVFSLSLEHDTDFWLVAGILCGRLREQREMVNAIWRASYDGDRTRAVELLQQLKRVL